MLALIAFICAAGNEASGDPTPTLRAPLSAEIDQSELISLAPYIVQLIQLAMWDPDLAARLVPDSWIDFVLTSAIDVEAEVPERKSESMGAVGWPVGPWASPAALAHTIKTIDPAAVGVLYHALRPRMTSRCRQIGATTKVCARALRTAVSRLCAPEVRARASGLPVSHALTATQIELARLGEPVVFALGDQLQILERTLWGKSRRTVAR
jgi:hypothetical protein